MKSCLCGEPVHVTIHKSGFHRSGNPKPARRHEWLTCLPCYRAKMSARAARSAEAQLDFAKDPCALCGHYPLSCNNKSGICRKCGRTQRGWRWYKMLRGEAA